MDEKQEYTRCSVAKLLGAIFLGDETTINEKLGVPVHRCLVCGKETTSKRDYCSWECRKKSIRIKVSCDYCGKLFDIREKEVIVRLKKGKHLFCNRKCLGSYNARLYGFIAHPENIGCRKKPCASIEYYI